MKKVICNPLNIEYRYQFNVDPRTRMRSVNREAADPSLILFQGRYYIFASMTLGVWVCPPVSFPPGGYGQQAEQRKNGGTETCQLRT